MKKQLLYIVAGCFALLPVACDKADADAERYGFGEGGIVMTVAPETRAVDVSGLTLADCTVFIYERGTDADTAEPTSTLIRKYAPENCPEIIRLLAGDYTVKVQWGERPDAVAFDKCFYEGVVDFAVTAGLTETVTVQCKPQSAVVDVTFASSVAASLTDYSAEFALQASDAATNALTFEKSDAGYFTISETGDIIAWTFRATHPEKGEILKRGEIAAEIGKKYALTFRYSSDLPGYISVDIAVDDSTDDRKDVLVFSQDPEVKGAIFDEPQVFAGEGMTVTMEATGDATVRAVHIYLLGDGVAAAARTRAEAQNETLVWNWPVDAADDSCVKSVLSADEKILTVTLNPAFFSFPIGETDLRFEVVDSFDSKVGKTATIRMNEGIRPVVESDYDLWTNAVTLHAVSSKGAPTFKLRLAGTTEWNTVEGTLVSGAADEYTATLESVWVESPNTAAGVPVYRPDTRWCVLANNRYEVAVEIDGHEYRTTFETSCDQPIPNSDMADASCSCFGTNNENTAFWGSGNNSFATALCARGTKSGRYCAHLKSVMAGMLGINLLASGNLFSGTFVRPSTTGTVSFGQDYAWTARPTALHLKYHATIGTVNQQKHKKSDGTHPANIGEQDNAIFYVAIVDWNRRHEVQSGTSGCSGMWSPDETTNPGEGPIIGYGVFRIDASTAGDELVDYEIPIYYYDKVTKPSGTYKLVISSATNIYGDYMCGCDSNELWLTDFKWVY